MRSVIIKEAIVPSLVSAKLYEERLRSCFSARLFSLPPPESDHFAGSTPRDILRRRQFTSESCMESLQAELRQKEKKIQRFILYKGTHTWDTARVWESQDTRSTKIMWFSHPFSHCVDRKKKKKDPKIYTYILAGFQQITNQKKLLNLPLDGFLLCKCV